MEASSTRADGIPSPSAVSFVSGFEMPFGTGVRQMFEGIPKKKRGQTGTDRQTDKARSADLYAGNGNVRYSPQMRKAARRKERVKRRCLYRRMRQRTSFLSSARDGDSVFWGKEPLVRGRFVSGPPVTALFRKVSGLVSP